jgi:phosphatidylinositol kinase/protein kinase (PI-3  family)
MRSKKKPLWLVFKNADENGENIIVMFKKGDDLRQDILTLQLFKIMNNLWFENKINLKMSLYNVICTGYFHGMLEMVKDSETLATIHKIYGGATATFSSKPLKKWFDNNATVIEKEYVNNFLLSCVAYCVSTFVLGIGDRHNDNIMVKRVICLYIEW